MTTVEDAEIVRVPHPDDMDTETFCKHVNARHAGSLPDGFTLARPLDGYTKECWLRWHERIHRLPSYDGSGFSIPELDHTHKEAL